MLRFCCYVAVLAGIGVLAVVGILRGVHGTYVDQVMLQMGMAICLLWVPAVFFVKRFGWAPLLAPMVAGSLLALSSSLFLTEELRLEQQRVEVVRAAELTAQRVDERHRLAEELKTRTAELSPDDLLLLFHVNEIAGQHTINGLLLSVTGTVDQIGSTILGQGFLVFQNTGVLEDRISSFASVRAYFRDSLVLVDLLPGETVTVVCEGSEVDGGDFLGVALRDCQLVVAPVVGGNH